MTALLALDARHGALLERLLGRCHRAAQEVLEDAGDLHALLTDEALFAVDAAAEREDRRAALGYVSPASARALLSLAARGAQGLTPGEEDAVTRACFRELDATQGRRRAARRAAPPTPLAGLLAGSVAVSALELAARAAAGAGRHGSARCSPSSRGPTRPVRTARATS